ncbi:hypothetical protein ACFFX0_24120 [Citricoccus parietis]|uniref:Uncharacterized protein n=1 Tax=Citricoccus parietis TaxID=592307 RepID=A0ABV5G5B1_9MICC
MRRPARPVGTSRRAGIFRRWHRRCDRRMPSARPWWHRPALTALGRYAGARGT